MKSFVSALGMATAAFAVATSAGTADLPSRKAAPPECVIRVLLEWSFPEIFLHTVYPTRPFLPSKLQVLLEVLKAWKSPLWIPLR